MVWYSFASVSRLLPAAMRKAICNHLTPESAVQECITVAGSDNICGVAGTLSLQDLDLGWCPEVTSEMITAVAPLTRLSSLQLARTQVEVLGAVMHCISSSACSEYPCSAQGFLKQVFDLLMWPGQIGLQGH